jgi:hypothetical protein
MDKLATDACMYCPNFTFFICRRLDRTSLESGEGDFVPESIISKMRELGEREVLCPRKRRILR